MLRHEQKKIRRKWPKRQITACQKCGKPCEPDELFLWVDGSNIAINQNGLAMCKDCYVDEHGGFDLLEKKLPFFIPCNHANCEDEGKFISFVDKCAVVNSREEGFQIVSVEAGIGWWIEKRHIN